MASVTQRIKEITQPRGGYLPIKKFKVESFEDGMELGEENIHSSLIGLAVDYLTRFMRTQEVEDSFKVSLVGARLVKKAKLAQVLMDDISGLDDKSIIAACKLVGFDVCARAGASKYKAVELINPDTTTIENIRIMVKRSLLFFEKYGPVIKDGFTFEGGYSNIVNTGDGDFLTEDTLWDFKVSKTEPKKEHTLQILMYYIMGKKSVHYEFQQIKNLGIYNPRLNKVYLLNIQDISPDIITEVANNVIGYAIAEHSIPVKKEMQSGDMYLSAANVAVILGISKGRVYKLIREGKIFATKRGNKYIIPPEAVEEYLYVMKRQRRIAIIVSLCICFIYIVFMLSLLFMT